MEEFIIVEVGSTTTKAYLCKKEIEEITRVFIPFKENYKKENKIVEKDKETLFELVNECSKKNKNIHVYGTSIFRNLTKEERKDWLTTFKENTGYQFHIVSAEEENKYTVYGVMDKNYNQNIAVMIGGGGSTEVSLIENNKITVQRNQDFGAVDITSMFPDLNEDFVKSDFDTMLSQVKKKVKNIDFKSDILVLAGGNYIYFYETLFQDIPKNNFINNPLQPYAISKEEMENYDKECFYNINLDEIKEKTKDPGWWSGARGMRLCVQAIFDAIGAKYIIPTKINMVYGINYKLREKN